MVRLPSTTISTPSLRTSWVAGYLEVEYSDNAKQPLVNQGNAACAGVGITLQNNAQCANADWSMARSALAHHVNPVQNLDVGAAALHQRQHGIRRCSGRREQPGWFGPVGRYLQHRRQLVPDRHLPRAAQLRRFVSPIGRDLTIVARSEKNPRSCRGSVAEWPLRRMQFVTSP